MERGGTAKGFYHVGVYGALDDLGIKTNMHLGIGSKWDIALAFARFK